MPIVPTLQRRAAESLFDRPVTPLGTANGIQKGSTLYVRINKDIADSYGLDGSTEFMLYWDPIAKGQVAVPTPIVEELVDDQEAAKKEAGAPS